MFLALEGPDGGPAIETWENGTLGGMSRTSPRESLQSPVAGQCDPVRCVMTDPGEELTIFFFAIRLILFMTCIQRRATGLLSSTIMCPA
jgi:hypothetical protein